MLWEVLWFAWKFVPLWYQQQPSPVLGLIQYGCDLLENSYLCGISNNFLRQKLLGLLVVICLKIRTFVVSATTWNRVIFINSLLWFAWKFVPLWYQQQRRWNFESSEHVVICLKIRTFVVSATTAVYRFCLCAQLWFAWKFVPLWYQQQQPLIDTNMCLCCDLLENSYLCGISNNPRLIHLLVADVVICLKIRTFVVSATTRRKIFIVPCLLWFAWKFVPLWYQQQLLTYCPDTSAVVICLKIRTFVVSATTSTSSVRSGVCCDLLENSYLCGISNNVNKALIIRNRLWFAWKFVPLWYQQQRLRKVLTCSLVVICLKIRTFVVSATTGENKRCRRYLLWFAWKFVPLWYQQQLNLPAYHHYLSCDLLENSYLCGISNNGMLSHYF